nr:circularly permuted type 2 ATP-grasp protein [uncultured Corynebacterium sp.]
MPRLIQHAEFERTERGLKQRVRALEAFLADIYGPGRVFTDGVIPRSVVTTSENFCRAVAGYEPPDGVRIHVTGVDPIRDGDGDLRVLEDNARVPFRGLLRPHQPAGHRRLPPEAVRRYNIARLDDYLARLHAALARAVPPGVPDPRIAVLTPESTTPPTSSTPCSPAPWACHG